MATIALRLAAAIIAAAAILIAVTDWQPGRVSETVIYLTAAWACWIESTRP